MARDSIYKDIVHEDMPVVERMALAFSQKSRAEWDRDPARWSFFSGMAGDALTQTACPTPAVIAHAREALRGSPELQALSDDQLAEVWEAMIAGIGGEAQNIASGYSRDGGPVPD